MVTAAISEVTMEGGGAVFGPRRSRFGEEPCTSSHTGTISPAKITTRWPT
jgi:hypothetical protein